MRSFKKLLLLAMVSVIATLALNARQKGQPNIVFILADDLGYASLNCYGADPSLVRTPHIDGIAETGMRVPDRCHR